MAPLLALLGARVVLPALAIEAGGSAQPQGIHPLAALVAGVAWGEVLGGEPSLGWSLSRATLSVRGGPAVLATGLAYGRSWALGGLVLEIDAGAEVSFRPGLGLGPALRTTVRYGAVGLAVAGWAHAAGASFSPGASLAVNMDLLAL